MRRIIIATMLMLAAAAVAPAQNLKFNADGTLKILQLTDLHLQVQNPENAAEVFARMDRLVAQETPDVIAITGDLIFSRPARQMLRDVVARLDSYKTPWCIVFGNHDAEQEMSRAEMSEIIAAGKYSLDRLNAKGELADIEVPVAASKGNGEAPFYLYFLDSNDYPTLKGIPGHGWFRPEQVQWMRDCCTARTSKDGQVAPSVAFFHIPLHEYIDAWAPQEDPHKGAADRSMGVGIRGENIAAGAVNTGMYAAMKETGSIVGTFAGHDHDSDFVAVYHGIGLCYGRFSGSDTVYNNIPRGGRVIVLREGVRGFETWIRDDMGRYINHIRFDGTRIVYPKGRSGLYGSWTEFE